MSGKFRKSDWLAVRTKDGWGGDSQGHLGQRSLREATGSRKSVVTIRRPFRADADESFHESMRCEAKWAAISAMPRSTMSVCVLCVCVSCLSTSE